jgi:hypothetical protein
MPFDQPAEPFSNLSPADAAVAELMALAGEGLPKHSFAELVRFSKTPSMDGKAWTFQKVQNSLERLIGYKVLTAGGEVSQAWLTPLILRASRRPDIVAHAKMLRAATPASWRDGRGYAGRRAWPYHDAHLDRAVRLMVLADDGEEVERLVALAEEEARADGCSGSIAWAIVGDLPLDEDFLAGRSPALRDRITAAQVERFLELGRAKSGLDLVVDGPPPLGDWSRSPRLDAALMRLDLLGERGASARTRAERLRAVDPAAALATLGALEFLEGSAEASLRLFKEALKHHRRLWGRRKIALPGEFWLFHVMALFAVDGAEARAEIDAMLDTVGPAAADVGAALQCLALIAGGDEPSARSYADRFVASPLFRGSRNALAEALITLALTVVDTANAGRRDATDKKAIEQWGGEAPLAARILSEIHLRFPSPKGRNGAFWDDIAESLGEGYARRFLDIVPIRPAWERALDKLKGFLAPPEAPPAAAPAGRRLIFRLSAETLEMEAVEQSAKARGWTAGRAVALKRLYQRDPRLDYLTAEDQAVARTVRIRRDYYSEEYDFDPIRGPLALVGHPRVFDAHDPDQQVELVACPPELVVSEAAGAIRVDLSHRATEPCVFIEPETPSRWRVIHVTPELAAMSLALGPKGLEVPRQAMDRVVALVRTENPRLPVRSELSGVAAEALEGDCRPILQIIPKAEGFHIHAVVRPSGDGGPAYATGQGSRSVLVAQDGRHRRVARNLEAESEALEAVAEACPTLAAWRDGDHDWTMDALAPALEALQELHACAHPLVMEWPQGAPVRPTATVGASALSMNISSGKDWFEVRGELRVDEDLVLDMGVLLDRIGRSAGRFVALDDGRYLALTEELRRRLEALEAVTDAAKRGRRVGTAGAMALQDLTKGVGEVAGDRRWRDLAARIEAARGHEPALPAGFEAELRDYQMEGFCWLSRLSRLGLGACLADDMGLGKTVQTLALLLSEAGAGPSLVLAPTSVCHNWMLEAERFTPTLRVRALSAAPDRAGLIESLGPGDVLVVSYGLLPTAIDLLATRAWTVAVFDESQNLKNAETRRAQASRRIDAGFRLALSGTPIENRLEELWSLFEIITPGLLGSRERFAKRFLGPIERGQGAAARQALKTLTRPYLLRRTKSAVLAELPSRTEIRLEIEPGPEERAFYEALRRQSLERLADPAAGGAQQRIRILAEITRLRRAACNPALIDPDAGLDSAKLAALLELVEELRAGRHRALVFSQFTGHLDLVEAALRAQGVAPKRLDGSTPARARARLVEAFQAGDGEIFLISLKAGGSGLNLTGADYVIHLDPWWNPAVEDQATDRAHRMGQTRPVTVYRLVTKGSIEEQILDLHGAKRTLAADFLDGTENAAPLGEDELLALIRG